MEIFFWLCLLYISYVEVGYLALLWLLSRFRAQDLLVGEIFPKVTVLIAVFNEEKIIQAKIENTLALDYPPDQIQILIASDSSSDRTDDIVSEYANLGVTLVRCSPRQGKIAALRAAENLITGELVLFTDADSMLDLDSLRLLTRSFIDPKVGAVSGREKRPPSGDNGKGKGEGLYNRIDTAIKTLEGSLGNQVGVHGGIFLVRRTLLPYVPDHLSHDAIVCLRLTLSGYKTLYEPEALSFEVYDLDTIQDWQRRVRTVLQSIQSYLYVKEALNPLKTGFFAFQIWSHRFSRWFVFPVLIMALVANLLLVRLSPLYQTFAVIQLVCYMLALVGFRLDSIGKQPAIFYFPFYFVYIHIAAFWAVLLHLSRRKMTTWRPTERETAHTIPHK